LKGSIKTIGSGKYISFLLYSFRKQHRKYRIWFTFTFYIQFILFIFYFPCLLLLHQFCFHFVLSLSFHLFLPFGKHFILFPAVFLLLFIFSFFPRYFIDFSSFNCCFLLSSLILFFAVSAFVFFHFLFRFSFAFFLFPWVFSLKMEFFTYFFPFL
jgi:hypothetical protein